MNANQSMTGYARAEGPVGPMRLAVEIKSVNHRYLDLKLHLPRQLQALEPMITNLLRQRLGRGRVDVWINLDLGETELKVSYNRALAKGMVKALKEMKDHLGLAGQPDLALLANQKDVIVVDDSGLMEASAGAQVGAIIDRALDAFVEMRTKEGATLAEDLQARLDRIEAWLARIAQRTPTLAAGYKQTLEKRIAELLGDPARVDPGRIALETAMFADRADITEEIVRFRSHLAQFRAALSAPGPKGRKLDFLAQEFFREINTASNKAQDATISGLAVEIKTELEKIREQVQNFE